jgi:uncharacterized metal-binding protein
MPIEAPGMPGMSTACSGEAVSAQLELDLLVVQLAGAQLLAELSRVAGAARPAPTSASSTRSSAALSALAAFTSLRGVRAPCRSRLRRGRG